MWRYSLSLLFVAVLAVLAGCGSPLSGLNAPERLIVFSLDGRDPADAGGQRGQGVPPAVGEFHGFPILGQVEVADPEQRKQLVATLKAAVARGGTMAKCYWPRHGIQAVENGKTVEYVICFECGRFEEFFADKRQRHAAIDQGVKPTFDKPLKEAGVAIAPQ